MGTAHGCTELEPTKRITDDDDRFSQIIQLIAMETGNSPAQTKWFINCLLPDMASSRCYLGCHFCAVCQPYVHHTLFRSVERLSAYCVHPQIGASAYFFVHNFIFTETFFKITLESPKYYVRNFFKCLFLVLHFSSQYNSQNIVYKDLLYWRCQRRLPSLT